MRLNPWNTMLISWARSSVSRRLETAARSSLPSSTEPEVGRSSAPSICSSVDLPPPVGPWMATICPVGMVSETRESAWTSFLPLV